MPSNQPVIIVAGLPRTGTSMMMRMLESGGVPVIVDELRTADDDNPRGYYEFEPAKQVADDPSFLDNAGGKAVKMVYRLLYDLPSNHTYKVVFMLRELAEVVTSQNKMLVNRGEDASPLDDAAVMTLFSRELKRVEQWLDERVNFDTLFVRYREVLERPSQTCSEINTFLGGELDEQEMSAVVEPTLYRNRS